MNQRYEYYEDAENKILKSDVFNYFFNKNTGYCVTYGKDINDDTDFCPFGPLIADIEISTICHHGCKFCYRANTSSGHNMSFETFKTIFHKFPKTLQQIAFGVSSCGETNPDIWRMFKYCRENGIVPNLTIADISDETADKIAEFAGACAVSRYNDKNICYDSVKKLTDRGMTQVNIHQMLSKETFNNTIQTIRDIGIDSRLHGLNAIVFLGLKQKGRGTNFNKLDNEQFDFIVSECLEKGIPFGFDSCQGSKFAKYCDNHNRLELKQYVTGCESTKQSIYVDVHGVAFPCSFCEDIDGWENGIDLNGDIDFVDDLWYNKSIINFRTNLCDEFAVCPVYKV